MTPIVIINWNGIEDTLRCIASLSKMDYQDYVIHLIDNGSKKEQVDRLVVTYANDPKVILHLYNENLGFTKAHIKVYWEELYDQNFEYLVLLNNDTEVDTGWLTSLISTAKNDFADMVCSKMVDYYNRDKMDNAGHKMLNTGEIMPFGHDDHIDQFDSSFVNMGACAGACLYSKRMIDQIGFFDPYFETGYEDAELGLRAILTGHKSEFCPTAIVYHKMGASIKKIFNDKYVERIQTNILYTYFKLMPRLNILLNAPALLFKSIALIIVFTFSGKFKHIKMQFRAWKNVIKEWPIIRQKRKEFYNQHDYRIISPVRLVRKLTFFLKVDLERFWNIFVRKRTSALEQYGE